MRKETQKTIWGVIIIAVFLIAIVGAIALITSNHKTTTGGVPLGGSVTKYAVPHMASYRCEPVQDKYGIVNQIPKDGTIIDGTDVGYYTNGISNIRLSFYVSYWSTDWGTRVGYALCDVNGNNCGAYTYKTDWVGGQNNLPVNSVDFTRETLKLIYQRLPIYIIGGWQNSAGAQISYDSKAFGLRLYSTTRDPAGAIICSTSCNLDCPDIGYRQKIVLPKPTQLTFYQTAPYLEYWETIDYDLNKQLGATIFNAGTNTFCFAGAVYSANQITTADGTTYVYPDTNTRQNRLCCPGARLSSTYSDQVCQSDYTWKTIDHTDQQTCRSDYVCPGQGSATCQNKVVSGYHCQNKDSNGVGLCVKDTGTSVQCCSNLDCVRDQVCDLNDHTCKGGSTLPVCGDGIQQTGEECDLGAQNGQANSTCTSVCKKVCVGADCNPSNPQCSTCWAWLKNKMGIQQICKIGFFSQIWDSLSCPFYFLKIAILFIASIFGLFFGQKVSARLFKIPLWATWLLGVVFMGIVFTIGWLFLSWYYIIPAIAIVVAGVVIVSMIPGGPALVGRSAGNLAKGYGSYRSSRR